MLGNRILKTTNQACHGHYQQCRNYWTDFVQIRFDIPTLNVVKQFWVLFSFTHFQGHMPKKRLHLTFIYRFCRLTYSDNTWCTVQILYILILCQFCGCNRGTTIMGLWDVRPCRGICYPQYGGSKFPQNVDLSIYQTTRRHTPLGSNHKLNYI